MENKKIYFLHVVFYCYKKGSNAVEIANEICDVYRDNVISVYTVCKWCQCFNSGVLKHRKRNGRPFTTDTELIKAHVDENPHPNTIQDIAQKLDIAPTIVFRRLKKITYANRYDVWLLYNLTEQHIANRVSVCDLFMN